MSHMNSQATPPSTASRHNRDMAFAVGSKLFYALTRVALPPLALAHVGLDEYGLWATAFVLISYLGMSASGFTNVYLRRVAQHHVKGDLQAISELLSTGVLTMALVAGTLLTGLYVALPHLLDAFHVREAMRPLATQLWLGACAVFLADMSLGAFANTLHAINQIRLEQKIWLVACTVEMVLIVLFLHWGWGVRGMLWAFAGRYVLSALAAMVLVRDKLPGFRLHVRHFKPVLLREFFGYGSLLQVADVVGTALHSADRLIAGALLGPQATAVFDLASKLPMTAASAPSSISSVTISVAARQDAMADRDALHRLYDDASRMSVLMLGGMLPFMSAFAGYFAQAWLGHNSHSMLMAQVMSVMCVGMHWHMLTGPASALFRGQGLIVRDYVYHGLRVAALLVAWGILTLWGSVSIPHLAWAFSGAQMASAIVYLLWAYRTLFGSLGGVGRTVIWPTVVAYGLAWALRGSVGSPLGSGRLLVLAELAGIFLIWLVLVGAVHWHLLLSHDERSRFRAWSSRFKFMSHVWGRV